MHILQYIRKESVVGVLCKVHPMPVTPDRFFISPVHSVIHRKLLFVAQIDQKMIGKSSPRTPVLIQVKVFQQFIPRINALQLWAISVYKVNRPYKNSICRKGFYIKLLIKKQKTLFRMKAVQRHHIDIASF